MTHALTSSSFTRRTGLLALLAAATTPVLAQTRAATGSQPVAHAQGQTAVHLPVRRPAVFDLGVLDAMHALGAPVAGVPGGRLPAYLSAYDSARYAKVGTLFVPDYAALSALKPDLVLVGGRSAGRYESLSKVLPTLDLTSPAGQLMPSMARNLTTLGQLFGREREAAQLLATLEADVARVKPLAQALAPSVTLLQVGERLVPQPAGSRFGMLHDLLGVPEAKLAAQPAVPAEGAKPRSQAISLEALAQLNPAWIFVIDRNAAVGKEDLTAQALFARPEAKALRAVQAGQVVFLSPQNWYLLGNAGPTALQQTLAQVGQALRKA